MPDDWKFRARQLCVYSSDEESAVLSGLKELAHFGYAELVRIRNPKTGHLSQYWCFSEVSKKPEEKSPFVRSTKKKKQDTKNLLLFEDTKENSEPAQEILKNLDFPVPVNPVSEDPNSVSRNLLNTKKEILNHEVLSNEEKKKQIQTSRESRGDNPHKTDLRDSEKQQTECYPETWLENFKKIYFENHKSILGESPIEKNSLETLFQMTEGSWELVQEKIEVLIEYRKGYELFWRRQCVSPETVLKFWSRLIKVEEVKYEKPKANYQKKKKEYVTKPPQKQEFQNKKNEVKNIEAVPNSPHECFLKWAIELLPFTSFEYYRDNRNPSLYEESKQLMYNKYFAEVAPPQFRTAKGVKACELYAYTANAEEKTA
ncbi:hypothetical protein DLM76_20665 [Leptospira yasudae]|nr:hypothetical protein DLM76_20665 [Leptospira yasudae]